MRRRLLRLIPAALLLLAACALTGASAPAQEADASRAKPEGFLMLPEPRSMRTPRSLKPGGSEKTVLSPARETAESPFIAVYTAEEFKVIGVSPETFAERARTVADRLLRELKPEWVRDDQGQIQYAVYRGDRPIYASLIIAPSLPLLFEQAFGPEVWVAAPDRNALYVFPAKAAMLGDFAGDLEQRYQTDPYAASCEIFSWKKGAAQPVVVGSFAD